MPGLTLAITDLPSLILFVILRESSLSVILRSEATKNLANNLSILRINSATEESNQSKVCEEPRFFATLRMTKTTNSGDKMTNSRKSDF